MAAQTIAVPVTYGPVTLHTSIVSPKDQTAFAADVQAVLDRIDLDSDERHFLEGVAAALNWATGAEPAEPHLPVEKCEHCDGRGGWGDDYHERECRACDGAGWVRP